MRHASRWAPPTAAILALTALAGCSDEATSPDTGPSPSLAVLETGNGAPSGAHYTLNIIGMSKDKAADFDGGSGHRIFVDLGRTGDGVKTRINLREGEFKYTTDYAIYRHISEGGNGMVPFRGQLSEREINLMVRFVQDKLRK